MHCDLCGREISWGYLVEIEGARLVACPDCADRGEIIKKVYERREERRPVRSEEESVDKEVVLVEDFGRRIMEARTRLGLSREELAKKLHISEGYLRKIEDGELTPTDDLAHKLEKVLGIKLFEEVEEEEETVPYTPEEGGTTLTLGDIVKLRWVKK